MDGEAEGADGFADSQGALLPLLASALLDGAGQELGELGKAVQGGGERGAGDGRGQAQQRFAHGVEGKHLPFTVQQQEAARQARRERALDDGDVVLRPPLGFGELGERPFEGGEEELHLPFTRAGARAGAAHLLRPLEERLVGSQQMPCEQDHQQHERAVDGEHDGREDAQAPELTCERSRRQVHPHGPATRQGSEPRQPAGRGEVAGRGQKAALGVEQRDPERRGSEPAQVLGARRRLCR